MLKGNTQSMPANGHSLARDRVGVFAFGSVVFVLPGIVSTPKNRHHFLASFVLTLAAWRLDIVRRCSGRESTFEGNRTAGWLAASCG